MKTLKTIIKEVLEKITILFDKDATFKMLRKNIVKKEYFSYKIINILEKFLKLEKISINFKKMPINCNKSEEKTFISFEKSNFYFYPSIEYSDIVEMRGDLFSIYIIPVIYNYDIVSLNEYRILNYIKQEQKKHELLGKNLIKNELEAEIKDKLMNNSFIEFLSIKPHSHARKSCIIQLKCNIHLSHKLTKYKLKLNEERIKEIINIHLRYVPKHIDIIKISESICQHFDNAKQKTYHIKALIEFDDTDVIKLYELLVFKEGNIYEIIHDKLKYLYTEFYYQALVHFDDDESIHINFLKDYFNMIKVKVNVSDSFLENLRRKHYLDAKIKIIKSNDIVGSLLRSICLIPNITFPVNNPRCGGDFGDILFRFNRNDKQECSDNSIKTNDILSRFYSEILGVEDDLLKDIDYNQLIKSFKPKDDNVELMNEGKMNE